MKVSTNAKVKLCIYHYHIIYFLTLYPLSVLFIYMMYNHKTFLHIELNDTEGGDNDNEQKGELPTAISTDEADKAPKLDGSTNNELLESPPSDYCPIGLLAFFLWGPLEPKDNRIDILTLYGYLTSGQKSHREEEKQSDDQQDFNLGRSSAQGSRGLSLGISNQKDVVLITQQQARLNNQKHEACLL